MHYSTIAQCELCLTSYIWTYLLSSFSSWDSMRPLRLRARLASSKSSMDVNMSEPRASAVRLLPALVCSVSRALIWLMAALTIESLVDGKQTLYTTGLRRIQLRKSSKHNGLTGHIGNDTLLIIQSIYLVMDILGCIAPTLTTTTTMRVSNGNGGIR